MVHKMLPILPTKHPDNPCLSGGINYWARKHGATASQPCGLQHSHRQPQFRAGFDGALGVQFRRHIGAADNVHRFAQRFAFGL